ncbi:MAG: FGGY family carbohydrate kinase [Actinomycetota bacterium]
MAILAIDQGTSATKAVVIDGAEVLGLAEVAIAVTSGADGSVELDPAELWSSVLAAGEAALAGAGHPTIEAVGLANQGETVLAWNRKTGAPMGPAMVWQDRRSGVVCDRLAAHSPRLAAITGLELDPYFVAPKMVWLRERLGHVDVSAVITTTDTWLLHRLCGAFTTDTATAGRTLLLDLDTGTWSDEACAVFGIDPTALPRVAGNTELLGYTSAFGGSVPVTGACVDQQAALFAERCRTAGEAKCTYGTGAFLLACTGHRPVRSTHGLVGCPAWQLGDELTWCLDGQVFTVGAAVSWLQSVGIIVEPADLDRLGASVADAGGVSFVPALAGLAAPFWKPHARAAFTGITLATERGHLVRAAIDGIAAQVALLANAVAADLGAPLQRLRVDGGLTRSTTLLQVQADLLQAPVEVYPSPHATVLGVAEFAAMGARLEFESPVGREPATVVEPTISADEAATRLAHWRDVAAATMDL